MLPYIYIWHTTGSYGLWITDKILQWSYEGLWWLTQLLKRRHVGLWAISHLESLKPRHRACQFSHAWKNNEQTRGIHMKDQRIPVGNSQIDRLASRSSSLPCIDCFADCCASSRAQSGWPSKRAWKRFFTTTSWHEGARRFGFRQRQCPGQT